ncbi:hypothetical protein, variant [Gaeumannomyces tritici R3-111a-1]|uniref:Uncharacterized protein n=1 Tax=Gaeumannomyces tritici (strain R3-111a-1) TaxID=644352 RepID=J3NS70_GAET3|nr:hypothetical protein GGTG_04115 [Gaeumannomyces tritici R3-111a-1]XP_009220171.1 hypothetical protein, variant [Gaeumannomyces tritici R3-111a-1]EJT79025.1 hypothetical protein, variant [Gaeumannomyces tritici R3-111a-1]EJT79026.1 hypothetical protein GGTG_04115 [Gaeumannomyces tritici R3-111a-1]
MDEPPMKKLEELPGEDVAQPGAAQGTVDSKHSPCRVIIRTRVTNINGPPEDRAYNLGQIFCSHVLNRQLRVAPDGDDENCEQPVDAVHFLPLCDSPQPVHAWFMYDLNFDRRQRAPQDLAQIPHEVYLCSLIDGRWIFTRRRIWSDEARKRSASHQWGGPSKAKSHIAMK